MKEIVLPALGILAALAVVLSPVGCTVHRQAVISNAIERGHDPMSAKCAMGTLLGAHDLTLCMAVVGKRNG